MNKLYSKRVRVTEPEPTAHQDGAGQPGEGGEVPGPQTGHPRQPGSREFLLRCLSASREPTVDSSQLAAHLLQFAAHSQEPRTDWDEVVAIAASHDLAPLLYKRLKENDAQARVPADVWERLQRAHLAGAVRSMCLYGQIRKVLHGLRSAGIPVIVLKGAYLAEAVYGDDALRPMADVDLMVPRAELSRAYAVVLAMDRVHQEIEDVESPLRGSWELRLAAVAGIDLCWTFDVPGGRSRLDVTGLWDRARPATIAGVEVLALSPEDLLLHVGLHAAHRHGLEDGLRPMCDIAETIQHFRNEMNWAQVVERAREWRATRYVGITLHLARSMLGAGVPDNVLEQLVPGGIDARILEAARESILAKVGYLEQMPFFDALGAKSIGEKAKLSWERVFLSRGEMAEMYPASRNSKSLYLYYALRVRDVVRTYWSHGFRRGRLKMQSRGRDRNAALFTWLRSERP